MERIIFFLSPEVDSKTCPTFVNLFPRQRHHQYNLISVSHSRQFF